MNDSIAVEAIANLATHTQEISGDKNHRIMPFVILPAGNGGGHKVEVLPEREHPALVEVAVNFSMIDSFCEYVKEFKNVATKVFGHFIGSRATGGFECVIDYHKARGDGTIEPTWTKHTAFLSLGFSPEFAPWAAIHGQPMSQDTFVEFIEDNAGVVHMPSAGTLMDTAAELVAKRNIEARSIRRLDDGRSEVAYNEKTQVGTPGPRGTIMLPKPEIKLRTAVFLGGAEREVTGRYRTKLLHNNAIQFIVKIDNLEAMLLEEVQKVAKIIEDKATVPVLTGASVCQKKTHVVALDD